MLKTIQGVPQISSESLGLPHMFRGVAVFWRSTSEAAGAALTVAARASSAEVAKVSILKVLNECVKGMTESQEGAVAKREYQMAYRTSKVEKDDVHSLVLCRAHDSAVQSATLGLHLERLSGVLQAGEDETDPAGDLTATWYKSPFNLT